MAMGAAPIPRTPAEGTNLWGPIAATAGQAIGNYMAGGYGSGATGAGAGAGSESMYQQSLMGGGQ